jgi:hypothetical protein
LNAILTNSETMLGHVTQKLLYLQAVNNPRTSLLPLNSNNTHELLCFLVAIRIKRTTRSVRVVTEVLHNT